MLDVFFLCTTLAHSSDHTTNWVNMLTLQKKSYFWGVFARVFFCSFNELNLPLQPSIEHWLGLVAGYCWASVHSVCVQGKQVCSAGQWDPTEVTRSQFLCHHYPQVWSWRQNFWSIRHDCQFSFCSPLPLNSPWTCWLFRFLVSREGWLDYNGICRMYIWKYTQGSVIKGTLCPLHISKAVIPVSQALEAILGNRLRYPVSYNAKAGQHFVQCKFLICKCKNWKPFQACSYFLSKTHLNSRGWS